MRTHAMIVKDGGVDEIARRRNVSVHTVRSWIQRNRIPPEHWSALAADEIATLEELAAGVEGRRKQAA